MGIEKVNADIDGALQYYETGQESAEAGEDAIRKLGVELGVLLGQVKELCLSEAARKAPELLLNRIVGFHTSFEFGHEKLVEAAEGAPSETASEAMRESMKLQYTTGLGSDSDRTLRSLIKHMDVIQPLLIQLTEYTTKAHELATRSQGHFATTHQRSSELIKKVDTLRVGLT